MNKLGDSGYELFIVTSVLESGAAGFQYFRRPPWNKSSERPRLEHRRLDTDGITKLGEGSFGDGLTKVENEGWRLIAVTTDMKGAVGFHYFMRPKEQ